MMDSQMRAWACTRRGYPTKTLQLHETLPRPQASDLQKGEVLVKITNAGICQGIAKVLSILPHFNSNLWIPEHDFSGIVIAIDSSISHLAPGDAVFGARDPKTYLASKRYNGVLAEYAIMPWSSMVKKPNALSLEEAAGLSANGCTAVQLSEEAELRPRMKVLITGGSSGLGTLTIQVVKAIVGKEGRVWTTCSAANTDVVQSLGADGVIDYRQHPNLHEHLSEAHSNEKFHVIIDIAGSDNLLYDYSPNYLVDDGRFIWAGKIDASHADETLPLFGFLAHRFLKQLWPVWLGGTPRRVHSNASTINHVGIEKVAKLVDEGKLRGLVDSTWEMGDVIQAYERVKTARARGKVIIHIQDP